MILYYLNLFKEKDHSNTPKYTIYNMYVQYGYNMYVRLGIFIYIHNNKCCLVEKNKHFWFYKRCLFPNNLHGNNIICTIECTSFTSHRCAKFENLVFTDILLIL